MSSCVRPGVCEVRASPVRLVSALMSEDLPTLERPAKAISGAPTGGRPSDSRGGEEEVAGAGEELASRFGPVRRGSVCAHVVGVLAGGVSAGFRKNICRDCPRARP